MRTPVGARVVGWNCIISMSFSATPARSAIAIPSPVHEYALVVPVYRRPAPPVARITVFAPIAFSPPETRSQAITPWQRPSSTTSFQAKSSS